MKHLTLFELHQIIQRVFYLNFEESIWIEAEISESRVHSGHVYITLVEKNENGQIVAKASCSLWRNKAVLLQRKLGGLFNQVVKTGNKVKMLCNVEFHPQYGYSLQVEDFDPAYTEGFLYLEKKKTISRLQSEDLFDKNKELQLPLVISRIAVVSSASAAGFQDFIHQLTANIHGYHFNWELFQSAMQGEKVESQFTMAMNAIQERQDEFDVIVVVRGGGASVDLSDFDAYEVAATVARSSLPVIAGIGHERDESVTGMVAFSQVKTPTAAAEVIIDHNLRFETDILQTYNSIRERTQYRLHTALQTLQHMQLSLQHNIQSRTDSEMFQLDKQIYAIKNQVTKRIHGETLTVQQLRLWIVENNPVQIMQRGYAMVYQKGNRLRSLRLLDIDLPVDLVMDSQKITINER
ncbi:MAG TPA: exodeoxyribonuclease VII large subunit [Membranihabitans sp.]|nr:exodeoxyribonuclease VII large subunit [Membranihabitans sp.]